MILKKACRVCTLAVCITIMHANATAQHINESEQTIKTYPFSDPNPVPSMGVNKDIRRFYPYFMFNAYTNKDTLQKWKVMTLDNKYITVSVLPEVGGKVYGAIEKSTGYDFVYLNRVLKFRAIGSRGPWTSGGIEHNFGLDIGHAPWAASPVDYIINNKTDGTTECIVGGLDLASRTQWRVIISLPPDKSYFETKALWYNPTPYHHAYLSWENAAFRATDDLEFYLPGNYHIGHDGLASPWPIDEQGRDISKYRNNNFGSSKSYHVMGSTQNWFGGLWQKKGLGFGHWAPYVDAPGKKLWIWSLARDGAIWEDLLTDEDGQYIEAQSGAYFNQADVVSGYHSPFKQLYLRPGYTETKYETWFPVKGITAMDDANITGSLQVMRDGNNISVLLSPTVSMQDTLQLIIDGKVTSSLPIHIQPLKILTHTFTLPAGTDQFEVRAIKSRLEYCSHPHYINRPLSSPENYGPSDAERLFALAEDKNSMRLHTEAMQLYHSCLRKEPSHMLALTRMAELYYRQTDYDSATTYARRALAINTYFPAANYIYGIILARTGKLTEAAEAFSIAVRSIEFRSEAYRQLAAISLLSGDFSEAVSLAYRSLEYNAMNIPARQVLCAALRKTGNNTEAHRETTALLDIDPLNHFAGFELYLLSPGNNTLEQFRKPIKNEFPHESYLELAVQYAELGLKTEAVQILQFAPAHPMVYYWLAYLTQELSYLAKADAIDPKFVFPFREESIPVLEFAIKHTNSWKPSYYISLIYWSRDADQKAIKLLNDCGNRPDFAIFYLTRAVLTAKTGGPDKNRESDLRRALVLEPDEWRTYQYLSEYLAEKDNRSDALKIWEEARQRFPGHVIVNLGYAKALLNNGHYKECLSVLKNVYVLPQEHANQGHSVYTEANLQLAMENIRARRWKNAIVQLNDAKKWPENLGSGRPYDPDERLQNFLLAYCESQRGNTKQSAAYKQMIIDHTLKTWPQASQDFNNYIGLKELSARGEKNKADELMRQWKKQTDSLQRWGLPAGVPSAGRSYVIALYENNEQAKSFEKNILSDPNNNTGRLFLEAIRLVQKKE